MTHFENALLHLLAGEFRSVTVRRPELKPSAVHAAVSLLRAWILRIELDRGGIDRQDH